MDEPLAASLAPDYAAGLVLLLLSLPGVPMLQSGDEVLAKTGIFSWNEGSLHVSFDFMLCMLLKNSLNMLSVQQTLI